MRVAQKGGRGTDTVAQAVIVILGLYFVGVVLIQGWLTFQNRMFYWNNESV